MKIKKIGFGYVKNLGGFENCRVYMEGILEDWENPSESLNILRTKVAEELNLPDKWFDLKGKFNRQLQALEDTNAALEEAQENLKKAQEKWVEYRNFLIAHGVDPKTLTLDNPYLSRAIITAHKLDTSALDLLPPLNESAVDDDDDDDDDDYFDPYSEEYHQFMSELPTTHTETFN